MPKISIIIPVFNEGEYLGRCLDSVLVALKGISGEILAVDNDSADNSLAILKKYAQKYPKIINVLQCHTPGAAATRNFGTSKARGEYIWFIDADDEIDKTAIKKLLTKAEKIDADLIMLGMKRIYPDGNTNYLSAVDPSSPNYKSRFVRYGLGPVQVLINRKWWVNNNYSFHEGIIHEDMELMSALILNAKKYDCVDEPLYSYHQNPNSVLHKDKYSPHIFDIFPALSGLYNRFKKAGAEKEYHDELEWFFIWNLLIDSAKDFASFPEGKPGFKRSREMLKKYFPKWRKNCFLKEKPLRLRIRVRLNYWK